MVKNLPTIERSTRIRFGKNATEDQAENTIVFNASNVELQATNPGAVYLSPIRFREDFSDPEIVLLMYNKQTGEITESGSSASTAVEPPLRLVTGFGNTTPYTIEFENPATAFVTDSNVGIANRNPVHTLDVGSNLFVEDTGSNVLTVLGNAYIQNNVNIDGDLNVKGVLARIDTVNTSIKDAIVELGRGNISSDLGFIMNRPGSNVTVGFREGTDELIMAYTDSSAENTAITPLTSKDLSVRVYGNVEANYFTGDGSQLSNIASTLQEITDNSNITSNTVQFTNPDVGLIATGNVEASYFIGDGSQLDNISSTLQEITDNSNITSNTVQFTNVDVGLVATGNVQANYFIGDGSQLTNLSLQQVTDGGNVTSNTVLLTNTDVGLVATGNVEARHFIGDGSQLSNIASDLQAISDNGNVTSNTILLTNTDVGLVATGNVQARHFIGDGSQLSNIASDLQAISDNGNVTSNTILLTNTDIGLVATGNIHANYFIGDGSQLEGLSSTLEDVVTNSNITSNTVQFTNTDVGIVATGNVQANYFIGNNLDINGTANFDSITVTNSEVGVVATGNVEAAYFIGDGSELTNITLQQVTDTSNTTSNTVLLTNTDVGLVATGNVQANYFIGDGSQLTNVSLQQVTDIGNVTSNTIQFTNPTTAFTTDLTSNVGLKLEQLANVNITTPQTDHLLVYDGSDWVNEYNIHNFIKVHNTTGSTLYKGNVVYIVDSFNNNVANVALAKADSASTMPAIGLIHEDVLPGQEGSAVAYGKVQGIDTTGFTEGQTVYVSNTSAGNIMNTKPYGLTDQIQNVGVCIKVSQNNGVVFVTGVGRSNDIPNAPIVADESDLSYVYVNDQNNDLKKIEPSNLLTQLQTLQQVTDTSNTTSNTIQLTNADVGLIAFGNIHANYFFGSGSQLTSASEYATHVQVGGDIDGQGTGDESGYSVAMSSDGTRIAIGSPAHDSSRGHVRVYDYNGSQWTQVGLDIDGGATGEKFGWSVAMSSDGSRVAIGAPEKKGLTNYNDGVVRVYDYNGSQWTPVGGDIEGDTANYSGYSVAMSSDGSRIAIGEPFDNGNRGRARVYDYIGSQWTQVGLDIDGEGSIDKCGWSVAISSDGSRVAVGAIGNDGTSGLTQDERGHVRVYEYNGSQWNKIGQDIDGEAADDESGWSVALSSDGSRVVIGAPFNDGNGNLSGHTRVYEYSNSTWNKIGQDIDGEAIADESGRSVAISSDGTRIAIGAPKNNGTNTGDVGHVRLYDYNVLRSEWVQVGDDIDGEALNDTYYGSNVVISVAMSSDGSRFAIGAPFNDGTSGSTTDNRGHVRVYDVKLPNALDVYGTANVDSITVTNTNVGITATGNVQANYFIGDGSQLSNITLQQVTDTSNITSNTIQFTNTDVGIVATGNIHANYFIGDGSQLEGLSSTLEDVVTNSNTTSNTVQFTNTDVGIVATGNVQANYFIGDGSQLEGLSSTLEDVVTNSNITSNTVQFTNTDVGIVATGNVHANNFIGNVYASNVTISDGLIVNTGGVTKKFYSYKGTINDQTPTTQSNVCLTFTSNIFYAKVVAHLVEDDTEFSNMSLEVGGGSRTGQTTPHLKLGSVSVFGNTSTNPWNSVVNVSQSSGVAAGSLEITPSATINNGDTPGTKPEALYNIFVEYISPDHVNGRLSTIHLGGAPRATFNY